MSLKKILLALALFASSCAPAYAVLPNIFATQPSGSVAASLLDNNFTFLESQGVQGLTLTGTSNAYVATPADAWTTGYSSYVSRALTAIPNFTNTGASTINVSGLGPAAIYKNIGGTQTALVSGDMVSGTPAILICDGTGFLLANPTPTSAGGGGAMVLLNTQIITSSTASISDTTHITNAYSHYMWECSNLLSSVGSVDGYITVQQGGVFLSSSVYRQQGFYSNSTTLNYLSGSSSQFNATASLQALSSTQPNIIRFEFWNPSNASNLMGIVESIQNEGGSSAYARASTLVNTSAATTGIKLAPSAGSWSTALCKIYGIQ